jgi:hypothetical protein
MNPQSTFNMYKGTRQFFGVRGDQDDDKSMLMGGGDKQMSECKVKGGLTAVIEIVIYCVFLAHFVAILMCRQSISDDNAVPQHANTIAIQSVCGVGIVVCILRIVLSHYFYHTSMESKSSRGVEMVFSGILAACFSVALGCSLDTRHSLDSATSTPATAELIKASKKHNNLEWILSSIGAGATSTYFIVNLIYVVKK